jgi:hypothetical protein
MRRLWLFTMLCAAPLLTAWSVPTLQADEEWEERTAYYEDDAWYDITEWLDGNDYNPTDEAVGSWDDEDYDWAAIESDQDSDAGAGYGYDANNADDDWYYDYYDDYDYSYYDYLDEDGVYDYTYEYYDYDDDGYYDAFSSYHDTDGDGLYDDYDYYSFNTSTAAEESQNASQTASNNAQQADQQQANQDQQRQARSGSKQFQASGQVHKAKRVKVRNGGDRLMVQLQGNQGKTFLIDLGHPSELRGQQNQQGQQAQQQQAQQTAQQGQQKLPVKHGDQLTAHGPVSKVGDKQVVLAQTVKIGNQQEQQINRSGRTINGQVTKLKTAKVREQEHQMAIVNLQSGKQALIDMGPADKLQTSLSEGDQVQLSGVPVKVKDRFVFIANSVTKNGEKTKIDRIAAKQGAQSS